jgi:hypothetical protein
MAKRFVSTVLSFDIRRWSRERWLRPQTQFNWVWKGKTGAERGTIRVAVFDDAVELGYWLPPREKPHEMTDRIPLAWSRGGPHGGRRPWFRCPGCEKPTAILYLATSLFRCRQCSGLAYESQYRNQEREYGC